MTINPAVYAKLSYSPERDFSPVSLLAEFPVLLAVGAEQPRKTMRELVAYGRANPQLANYASSATPFQLAAELFNQRTGSKFQHIPYRGSGDAVQAVVAGQVLMALADSGPMSGPIKGGKLRALALTAAKRNPVFPDVPTITQAGIPGLEISLLTCLLAPINPPPEIVSLLQQAIRQILVLDDVKSAMGAIAVEPRSTTPDEYRDLIARATARSTTIAAPPTLTPPPSRPSPA